MLSVENCLRELNLLIDVPVKDSSGNTYKISNTWDRRFIEEVNGHAAKGQPLSTAQGTLALKLIQRYRDHLITVGVATSSVDALIATPFYDRTPYPSTNLPREVRYAGDNKLVFRCKYNSGVIEDIKALKGINHFTPHPYPMFNHGNKLWIVDVNRRNWEKAMDVINRHKFSFDDAVASYFHQVSNSMNQLSSAEADDGVITVTARDDDFLSAWAAAMNALEI